MPLSHVRLIRKSAMHQGAVLEIKSKVMPNKTDTQEF